MIEKWDDELPAKQPPRAFCPNCGAPRSATDRFCASCGKPFAEAMIPSGGSVAAQVAPPLGQAAAPSVAQAAPPLAQAAPTSQKNRLGRGIAIIVGVLVIALTLLGGVKALSGIHSGGGGTVAQNANVPPVGVAWFGTSFDSSTFEVHGQGSYFPTGTTVAMVAHLTQSISSGEANMRITLNGQTIANSALNNINGSGDIFGVTYPLPIAGTYVFTITDIGGNQLATGSVTAQ